MIDICRANLNAKTRDEDPTDVELPNEMNAPPGTCGLLRRHMYGTQRAAEGWQDEYSSKIVEAGFIQVIASPCVFHHPLVTLPAQCTEMISQRPDPNLNSTGSRPL